MKQQLKLTLGKAFFINETKDIYGTFAEIGAGQETVNCFFKAGLASQTVAKSISAYDMTFSNLIYGKESRYISKHRLMNMLKHEYRLLQSRLQGKIGHHTRFFAFANTATTASKQNTDNRTHHGWIGLRFQAKALKAFNDCILHVNFLDKNRLQQHEALGILGVNLIYSCFYKTQNIKTFVASLMENLDSHRVRINWIHCKGESLKNFNPAALNLELLRQNISSIAFFNSKGESEFLKDSLFQKSLFIVTGKISPPTLLKSRISGKTNSALIVSLITLKDINGKKKANPIPKLSRQNEALFVFSSKDLSHLKQTLKFYTDEKLHFVIPKNDFEDLFRSTNSLNLLNTLGLLFDTGTKVLIHSNEKGFSLKNHRFKDPEKQLLKEYLIYKNSLSEIV